MLELGAELAGVDLHYTIDDTMPDRYCPKYAQPVELPEGPITLRVLAYRKGQPIGHLITLKRAQLEERVGE